MKEIMIEIQRGKRNSKQGNVEILALKILPHNYLEIGGLGASPQTRSIHSHTKQI